ncbi:MAG: hypothetical protein M1831_006935 [Alyxoria varia]|nr:MAG: hypothetical protein M1831_006935 [Alyxoria varia]
MSPASPQAERVSDLIASDFKDALAGIQGNDLLTFRTLTTIARDNVEYAGVISQTVIKHIQESPSYRKLTGIYMLDSIVKNIGSPFQEYFAANLFKTFMDAYAVVDTPTRKQMEAVLKTWKLPPPKSMETRPVFKPNTTAPIENALEKARLAFLKHQSNTPHMQRQPHALPPRPTATPHASWGAPNGSAPSMVGAPVPPIPNSNYPGHPPNGYPYQQAPIHPQPPQSNGSTVPLHHHPAPHQWAPHPEELRKVRVDLENLIARTKIQFASNIGNTELQNTLKALISLQTYLNTQRPSPEDWQKVKDTISRLSTSGNHPMPNQAPAQPPAPHTGHSPGPTHIKTEEQAHATPLPNTTSSPLSIKPEALAQLLSSTTPSQRPTPSNAGTFAQPQHGSEAKGGADTNSLIASLVANGLLPATTPHSRASSAIAAQSAYAPPAHVHYDVELTTASMKIQCGRRFATTLAGKERKARHLDYHFRTNRKMAETSTHAPHRSWYIDEVEWIRFRELDDADAETDGARDKDNGVEGRKDSTAASGGTKDGASSDAKETRFIKAPTDVSEVNDTCPICLDNFETSWHVEAQEFVWMDTVMIGNRVYHGTCYDEISPPEGRSTPVPAVPQHRSTSTVLGKRKSDSSDDEPRKIKRESYD